MELLYGESKSTTSQDNTSSLSSSRRYIRQAQMTDDIVMNLINLDGQLYVLSSEISNLFFEEDIVSSRLYKDSADMPKVVVTRKDHPGLFKELALYGAPNFNQNTNVLSLFSLSALPLIIEMYGKKGAFDEMKGTALEILQWFDPDDPYWKGEDDSESTEVDTHSSMDDSYDIPGMDDLQLVLSSLEIKRKRILQRILTGSVCTPDIVNELNDVELNVKRVEALVAKLQCILDECGSVRSSVSNFQAQTGINLISDLQLPVTSSQFKCTQKVAPMMQTSSAVLEPFASTMDASSQLAPDMNTLLQQHMLLNRLMMDQLRMSQEATSVRSQCGQLPQQSFGRGVGIQQQQQLIQPGLQQERGGNPTTMVTQSLPNPVLSLGNTSAASPSQLSSLLSGSTSGIGAGVEPSASNLLKGLGRGLPLEMYTTQLQQPADFLAQSQLLQQHLQQTQSQGHGHTLLQNQQSLQGTQLLQQLNSLNAKLAALGLSSSPMNSLSNPQFASVTGPTHLALSGQQPNLGGLLPNLEGVIPSWYSTDGCASSISQPGGLSSNTALPSSSLIFGTNITTTASGVSQGLANSALLQSQFLQQPTQNVRAQLDNSALMPHRHLQQQTDSVRAGQSQLLRQQADSMEAQSNSSALGQSQLLQQPGQVVAAQEDLMSMMFLSRGRGANAIRGSTKPGARI